MDKKEQARRSKEFQKHYSETKPLKVEARDGDEWNEKSICELEEELDKETDLFIEKLRRRGEIKMWIGMIIMSIAVGALIGMLISKI
jgi:hypothetical protein